MGTAWALAGAGYRRYSTYRQATVAGAFTNTVFGFLRCYVMLAVLAAAGGTAGGYRGPQLVTYVWIGQGLLAVVQMWGWTDLADRIRTGDVQSDLLRPVHPVASYLATDLGRAGHAALTRFVVPTVVGALCFRMYAPHAPLSYPAFLTSVLIAVVASFGLRYLVNLTAFWLLDIRGVLTLWLLGTGVLSGLYFPLAFLPGWAQAVLWLGTPFPATFQAPIDILVEHGSVAHRSLLLVDQLCWASLLIGACLLVQRRAERRLVVQGG